MPEINLDKSELRRHFRELRHSLDDDARRRADRTILERLMELDEFQNASLLLVYVSNGEEIDTLELIVRALAEGKQVACPRCDKASHTMDFYRISSLAQLSEGAYGIYEPMPGTPPVKPEELADSVCVVPGLSFDASGGRLGYGGGYYDRFLAGRRCASVGLCRKASFSHTSLPQDGYDVKVDIILTETDCYRR